MESTGLFTHSEALGYGKIKEILQPSAIIHQTSLPLRYKEFLKFTRESLKSNISLCLISHE